MNVLIIDDDPFVCRSLERILTIQPDIAVVGIGSDGSDALTLFAHKRPDVLLMDIQMKKMDGLSAASKILSVCPDARIVFLTTFADDDYIVGALRLGARGYLIKQDADMIAPALRSVMAGQRVLEGEVLERAISLNPQSGEEHDESALAGLTEREREVARLVADGLGNAEIANRLYVSEGTIRNHISSMLAKLDPRNRTQIAVFYYRHCS